MEVLSWGLYYHPAAYSFLTTPSYLPTPVPDFTSPHSHFHSSPISPNPTPRHSHITAPTPAPIPIAIMVPDTPSLRNSTPLSSTPLPSHCPPLRIFYRPYSFSTSSLLHSYLQTPIVETVPLPPRINLSTALPSPSPHQLILLPHFRPHSRPYVYPTRTYTHPLLSSTHTFH